MKSINNKKRMYLDKLIILNLNIIIEIKKRAE